LAKTSATFLEETKSAVQGCIALITGRPNAPSFFDFSQRGLVGSLIAVVLGLAIAGFGPLLLGAALPGGAATQSIIVNAALFLAQAGTAYVAMRQMGRQDGFMPYMVASNWVTLVSAVLLLVSLLLGPLGMIILIGVVIVAIATFINIGRLIVTLSPIQIGILFVSQAVGVFIALAIVAVIIGPSAAGAA
jgi:hypothetical protein